MRPFVTPLFEVSTELNLAFRQPVDFPGLSLYTRIADVCPRVNQFPVLFVPPENMTPQQLQLTPAVYRFSSADERKAAFLGPRMVAANIRGWQGYGRYRSWVERVFGSFIEVSTEPILERHSVGFYNRVPVASIDELREILSIELDLAEGVELQEIVFQSARQTATGSLLTQLMMMPANAETPEPYLAITNIIRATVLAGPLREAGHVLSWLDEAHQDGRDAIWTILSERARESWKANDPQPK